MVNRDYCTGFYWIHVQHHKTISLGQPLTANFSGYKAEYGRLAVVRLGSQESL